MTKHTFRVKIDSDREFKDHDNVRHTVEMVRDLLDMAYIDSAVLRPENISSDYAVVVFEDEESAAQGVKLILECSIGFTFV